MGVIHTRSAPARRTSIGSTAPGGRTCGASAHAASWDTRMIRFVRLFPAVAVLWLAAAGTSLLGQQSPAATTPAAPQAKPDAGIPITSPVVRKACGSCHASDDKQQMSRISFQRNTPEGWQQVIRRMVALNGLRIEPETAREVVAYLSNHLGLAPDEARPAAFEVERRIIDYAYTASPETDGVCKACHTMGRVISQRRTRDEWDLLIAMHRGYYPLTDNQVFRRSGPAPRDRSPDGRPADTRHPVEKAVDHLAAAFPLQTPAWAAWSATMRPARLDGTWAISGQAVGRGPVYGQAVVRPVAGKPDEFTTEMTVIDARTGTRETRTGQGIVYTGFQWRGRSSTAGNDDGDLREVMFVDRDWRTMDGRWFTGAYDEIGIDVTLTRAGSEPRVLGTDRTALPVGASGATFRLYGINLPPTLQPGDIDLGPGVTVTAVSAVTPDQATITVNVDQQAVPGVRDVFVAGSRARALAVYDRIDGLKVTPAWAMARVGGVAFPKGLAHFEARAFANGPDNRPDTADDIDLGIVPATWSLEEFAAVYGDDDIKYVGAIDPKTGVFTPNVDGPNPERKGNRNNIGDVYAVATYTPEPIGGKPAQTLRGRAHLLVTVPLYMRWEAPGEPR